MSRFTTDFRCPPEVSFSRKRKCRRAAPNDAKGHALHFAMRRNSGRGVQFHPELKFRPFARRARCFSPSSRRRGAGWCVQPA
jgi:hypothetical protein